MFPISQKLSMAARRAVLSSGTGNLLAAAHEKQQQQQQQRRRPLSASSPHCFPISLTSQDNSKRPVVMRVVSLRSRQFVVYDSKRKRAPRRPTGPVLCVSAVLLKARTRLMKAIRDAGRKLHLVKVARECVQKVRTEVLQQLLHAHQERMSRLEKAELLKVVGYTRADFVFINEELRSGSVEPQTQECIRLILKAMAKDVLPVYRGTVYRGTVLPQNVRDELRPGATYCDRGFLSSSTDEGMAFLGEDGCVEFVIESKSGVDISSVSGAGGEMEVLFRPSTVFKILSMVMGEFWLVVTMEEIF
jgi:hypothetical protein